MNILNMDAEKLLMEFMDQIRLDPKRWRALHFNFSSLQPQNRQPKHMQTVQGIIRSEVGSFPGAAYFCQDGDLIIVFENGVAPSIETMITDFRFLFADDPLASASYVSGQPDAFFTTHDLAYGFDQFFHLCLHKLAMAKQDGEKKKEETEEAPSLPSLAFYQKVAEDKLERKMLRILVAEDSYFSRQMIRQALLAKNEVLLAKDGWEAVAQYFNYAPNIMFLDIDMPHMNGHQVLQKIKEYDPKPFVIMLTASNLSNDIKSAITEGAKGYIVKPFTVGKLTAYIDQYCKEVGRVQQILQR